MRKGEYCYVLPHPDAKNGRVLAATFVKIEDGVAHVNITSMMTMKPSRMKTDPARVVKERP